MTVRKFVVLLLASALALGTTLAALAQPTMLEDFTQSELDTKWEPDRQEPTGEVTSVSAFGRDNVVRIGLDSSQTQPGTFQRTEGIKTISPTDFGDGVKVDLYVDPDWQDKAVRAGLWVVGSDGAGDRDDLFAIIEFVNNESCPVADCSNQGNITDHEGWRIWDSTNGWTNVAAGFNYGEWVTLAIELDPLAEEYHYFIDGNEVGTGPGGENFIHEVFLNSYNYGEDDFPTFSNASYSAHWHAGLVFAVGEATYMLCSGPNGGLLFSAINGQCGPGKVEVETPSETPLAFCINPYSGAVRYTPGGACPMGQMQHVVPDDGDLVTCVNIYTGRSRFVFGHSLCTGFEVPNVIPAGDRRHNNGLDSPLDRTPPACRRGSDLSQMRNGEQQPES